VLSYKAGRLLEVEQSGQVLPASLTSTSSLYSSSPEQKKQAWSLQRAKGLGDTYLDSGPSRNGIAV
jgi:hypothetical protein